MQDKKLKPREAFNCFFPPPLLDRDDKTSPKSHRERRKESPLAGIGDEIVTTE